MKKKTSEKGGIVSRRDFIKTTAAAGMAAMLSGNINVLAKKPKKMRVALLGCGDRGNGALNDCVKAAEYIGLELEIVATADWFKDKAETTGKQHGVPPEQCFGGADGYRKLLDSDADVVLMATPPNFRPIHFEAAIQAGKHVFMEKPVAVDPPGFRRIIKVGELAEQKGLAVVAGTQRRHQSNYRRIAYAVERGAIGKILGGYVSWCDDAIKYRERKPNESDADYMIRNWGNFSEMSGDHIVEQHVHNIDIANWFIGHHPKAALGFGGRAHRKTGNQFDFFSVDLNYGEGCHIHSMCRQINGCDGGVRERFAGTKGTTWGDGGLRPFKKKKIKTPTFQELKGPYVQEHIDLLNSILEGKPLNETRNVAEATLAAIMGRISSYTGKLVRWSDLAENQKSPWYNLTLTPTAEDFEKGEVKAPPDNIVPVPGKAAKLDFINSES